MYNNWPNTYFKVSLKNKKYCKNPSEFRTLVRWSSQRFNILRYVIGKKKSLILTSLNYQRIIFVDTKNECTWYVNIYFKYVKVIKQIFFFFFSPCCRCSFSYYNNNKLKGKHLIKTKSFHNLFHLKGSFKCNYSCWWHSEECLIWELRMCLQNGKMWA